MVNLRRAAIALSAWAFCACGDGPTKPDFTGLRIVSGADASDTISTELVQALLVELRDDRGVPVADHLLRFNTVPVDEDDQFGGYTAYVSRVDQNNFGTFVADRTDQNGRARVLVMLGLKAGPALVIVTDPDLGTADTATFTVRPGQAVGVVAEPRDTAVYVGGTVTLRGAVVDRAGNPRADPVTHTVVGTAVTISGMTVTGVSLGTAQIRTTAGTASGTTTISVPPQGTIAAFTPRGLATVRTDGSEFRVLVPAPLSGITTAWSPSGTEVAFDRTFGSGSLQAVTLTGAVRQLSSGSALSIYPEYSRDGQWVFYSRDGWRLYRVHPDGTGDELVPMQTPQTDAAASPSANGSRLVYTLITGGGSDQLWMLDMATGASTNLNVQGHQPAWSPNGSLIAFLGLTDNSAIKVMNPDATGIRTVSGLPNQYGFGIDWSPDSQWIVAQNFAFDRVDLINAASGQIIPLGFARGYNGPSWKP